MLELERTEDILQSLGQRKRPGQVLVGFAAETDDLLANAQGKLERKNLDWIAANDVRSAVSGFGVDTNAITLLSRDARQIEIPLADKLTVARRLLEIVARPISSCAGCRLYFPRLAATGIPAGQLPPNWVVCSCL